MSNLTMLCRVCLAVDVRMFTISNTPLQEIYEKLTNILLTPQDQPVLACYICHSLLKRCLLLQERAQSAGQLLTQFLQSGVVINQGDSIGRLIAGRQAFNLTGGYCVSPIELISTVEEEEQTEVAVVEENRVKEELLNVEKNKEKADVPVPETNHHEDHQFDVDDHPPSDHQSDSDDDVPLKNISVKKRLEQKKTRVRVRKKEWPQKKEAKGFIADFAKEIILTKEEQLQELKDRAKSLNYLNSPLKCELCYKGFIDARAYENHRGKHDERSGPHECDICHMRYSSSRQLRTHAATSHARRYKCRHCPHTSHTANQAREHEKWHSGYTYECKLCGQAFRKPTSYLTHMRKRHPTPHVCNLCGDSFVGRHGLLMHKSKAHKDDKPAENQSEPESDRFCSECNIQFATVDAWKRHILSSVTHTLENENSPQCRICSARFPSTDGLSSHLREHEKALKAARSAPVPCKATAELACDQCGSHFVNRSKLQAHVKRIHLGLKYNKNIVCEVCGKKCTSNASLKYHQRTHTGEKPYQCSACNKKFSDNNQLRIHTRTHTGERPYCCAACGKRFSQKPALNRHYRVHTGAKPYMCQLCSKTFSQSNSLKVHVKTVHLKLPANRNARTEDAKTEDIVILHVL